MMILFWVGIVGGCFNLFGYIMTPFEHRGYQGLHYSAIMFFLLALCCK